MWKPWILIAVGSVMALSVAAKGHYSSNSDSEYDFTPQQYSRRAVNIMDQAMAVQNDLDFSEDYNEDDEPQNVSQALDSTAKLQLALTTAYYELRIKLDSQPKSAIVDRFVRAQLDNLPSPQVKIFDNMETSQFIPLSKELVSIMDFDNEKKRDLYQFIELSDFVDQSNQNNWNYNSASQNQFSSFQFIFSANEERKIFGYFIYIPRSPIDTNMSGQTLSGEDLNQIMEYGQLRGYKKAMEMFGRSELSVVLDEFSEYEVSQEKPPGKIDVIKNGLDAVQKTWDSVKNAFRSEEKNKILERVVKMGFNQLESNTYIQMFEGVPMAKFSKIQAFVNNAIQCPPEKKQHLDKWWGAVDFVDESAWNFQNLVLTQDNAGNAKYLTLMYNKDEEDNISFLIADTKASFNVADDMWMWERSTSKFGGIMQKEEQIVQYLPHTVSIDDVKILMNIFDTIALNKFKQYIEAIREAEKINSGSFLN